MHTITCITVGIEARQTVAWPHFAGSTLRGAFGRALRQAACLTGQPTCNGCPLRASCAYGVVFDPAAPTQPIHPSFQDGLPRYLVQPPPMGACQLEAGGRQQFNLVLLPQTESHLKFIQHVLTPAVEQHLMRPGWFRLTQTQVSAQPVVPDSATKAPSLNTPRARLILRWLTPMRLQHRGKPVFSSEMLDASLFVKALLRRQMQWCQYAGQPLPDSQADIHAASACRLDASKLFWHDTQRHSSIRNEKIPLGGLMGSATLHGPTAAVLRLYPLLQMAETLHIGKEIVMGLGRYQLGTPEPD